jgi:ATP-dependent Clp protease ATP-binding subunit ClpC
VALSAGVQIAWNVAAAEAHAGRSPTISPGHLLIGLCKLCDGDLARLSERLKKPDVADRATLVAEVRDAFARMGVDPVMLRRRVRTLAAGRADRTRQYADDDGVVHRDRMSRRVFRRATDLAAGDDRAGDGAGDVRAWHLLQAALEMPDDAVTRALVEQAAIEQDAVAQPEADGGADDRAEPPATPTLDRIGRDLSALARAGRLPPVIGRRAEMRTLARALVRHGTNSAILVGEPGVGKTGVVEGLATLAASADAPAGLAGLRFVELPQMVTAILPAGRPLFRWRIASGT